MSGELAEPAMIWCPFENEAEARRVAGQLLDENLVACANILPPMISLFTWQGKRGEAEEVGVFFKTNEALLHRAVARLVDLHPYDIPAIMGWRAQASPRPTTAWLNELTGKGA